MSQKTAPPAQGLTTVQWLICIIAAIGFAFDIYELLMLPLILGPASQELLGTAPGIWKGIMFFVPAFVGGLVGMWGGVLTDRLGRRFVLTWSIILYAVSAFLAGFSTNIYMLLFFRCTTFIGVCVEFVAAVAWLAELFPNPIQREKVLGYTQAFSSIGGLLVAIASEYLSSKGADGKAVADALPAIAVPGFLTPLFGQIKEGFEHAPWRYTLMSGLIPALPLIIIRPFLPESPIWAQKKAAGTLRRPSFAELFSPELRRTTLVTTIMFACSYGAAFGAIQQLPEIVKGLKGTQAQVEAAVGELKLPPDPDKAKAMKIATTIRTEQKVASQYTKMQEVGGLVGRFLLALLAVKIASRQKLMRIFQGPGLFIVPLIFYFFLKIPNTTFFELDLTKIYLGKLPVTTMSLGMFLAGLFTVAQFSFWGNYLPLAYPVHLRGTGESFAANIGGRMFGTSFALLTTTIVDQLPASVGTTPEKFALTAAGVAAFAYLLGNLCCFFLPEPDPNAAHD